MTAYSGNHYIGGSSSRKYDCYVNAWVSSQTDTTATIGYEFGVRMSNAYLYGVACDCYADGSWQKGAGPSALASSPGSSWATVCSGSGYVTVDKRSQARSVAVTCNAWGEETSSGYGSAGGSLSVTEYVSVPAVTYHEPNAPSALSSSREGDSRNSLTWTAPTASAAKPVDAQLIERSVDGGAWSQIASVGGSATSYSDTATSADHSYAYRIRSRNDAGCSGYATSGTTYNTPAAPTGVAASRLAEAVVSIAIANASKTATALELQRSADASSWETVATFDGSPVTSATDEPGGGTFYYRARNTRGQLASAWSGASAPVVTICAPAAPTLVSPASGSVVRKSSETVDFAWLHNAPDGSAQTAAKLRYSTDRGATYTEVGIAGGAASYSLENGFPVNSEVTYSVRTKGAHADYGPWSDSRVFYVRQEPSVAFARPADGFVVENTPIAVELQYSDASGALASATLSVSDGARVVYSRDMGTGTSCEIAAAEWTPENGASYTLTAQVRSTSTLGASAVREVSVDFAPPHPAGVAVSGDSETGYAALSVYIDESDDALSPVASVTVWRKTEDGAMLLGDGLRAGAALVDKYAPLNVGYSYVVVSYAESGAANRVEVAAMLEMPWAFLYFPGGGIARGMWDPAASWKMKPDVDYVRYVGREFPVPYMRDCMEETHDVTVALASRDEARAFRRMMAAHEPVVAKLWDALVFHAVPQLQGNPDSAARSCWGEVNVKLKRIDGEAL